MVTQFINPYMREFCSEQADNEAEESFNELQQQKRKKSKKICTIGKKTRRRLPSPFWEKSQKKQIIIYKNKKLFFL